MAFDLPSSGTGQLVHLAAAACQPVVEAERLVVRLAARSVAGDSWQLVAVLSLSAWHLAGIVAWEALDNHLPVIQGLDRSQVLV